jgi:hypothetical protein
MLEEIKVWAGARVKTSPDIPAVQPKKFIQAESITYDSKLTRH